MPRDLRLALRRLARAPDFAAAQRTCELGIRLALGAGRRDVLWDVLRHALVVVGIGIAAGFFPACRATRVDPMAALRSE